MSRIARVLASLALSGAVLATPAVAGDYFQQPEPFGCGPAAAVNCFPGRDPDKVYEGVCQALGDPGWVNTPRPGWPKNSGGVSRTELCDALKKYDPPGNWTVDSTATVDDVKKICANGGTAIMLFPDRPNKPGHFVAVCDATAKTDPEVTIIDPADGKRKRRTARPPYIIIYPKKTPATDTAPARD